MVDQAESLFYNKMMDRTAIRQLIGRLIAHFGITYTTNILDQIKTLGFQQATKASISLGIDDPSTAPSKAWLVQDAERQGYISEQYHRYGSVHAVERLRQSIETWYATSEYLKQEMNPNFRMTDPTNPVHMMSFSGSRGSISQVHQLVGMRGLMSDPQGQIIDSPIRSNPREGLSLTEYIISRYGARKGVVDTAVRTSDAGYLTRRLVEVVQHIVVRETNCGTTRGIIANPVGERKGSIRTISQHRLIGRVLADNVYLNRRCIAMRNQDIGNEPASNSVTMTQPIHIRSPLTCRSILWIRQLCYGWSLTHHDSVELGEAVGIIAGQSIGEPGTQSTSRTSHTGGVSTGDIAEHVRTPFSGLINFDEDSVHPTRTRHGHPAWICQDNLPISLKSRNDTHNFIIPSQSLLLVRNNQYVESKQIIAEIRAKEFPLKERVYKYIYPNLEGETHWSTIVRHSSEHIHSNIHVVRETGHVWVLSGSFYDSSKEPLLFHQDQDNINVRFSSNKHKLLLDSVEVRNGRDPNSIDSHGPEKKGQEIELYSKLFNYISDSLYSTIILPSSRTGRDGVKNGVIPLPEREEGEYNRASSCTSFIPRIANNGILDRNDILAISENPKYRTSDSGVTRYGTIKVGSVEKKEFVLDGGTKTFRSRYKVIKGGNFFLIPEEVHTVYQPFSSVSVSNNSIIEEGTRITSSITSQVGGSVRIKRIRNSIEIRILPGYIHYPKRMCNVSKQNDTSIPPGKVVFDEFKSDNWIYLQWIALSKRKTSAPVRPVIEYNIPDDYSIEIPPSFNLLKEQEDLQIQASKYILYEDGEEIRIRNNTSIQLVQDRLVVNWKEQSFSKKAYVSLIDIRMNNPLSTSLRINLMGCSNSLVERKNNKTPPRCISNNKLFLANYHLFDSDDQSFIKYRGTIRLVPNQGTSFLILSPSNLFRDLLYNDSGEYDGMGGYGKNPGSKENNSIRQESNLKDPYSDPNEKFRDRSSRSEGRLTESVLEFDLDPDAQGKERLGLSGNSQSIPHSPSYAHSISKNKVPFSVNSFVEDSTNISQHPDWYLMDENRVMHEYPSMGFMKGNLLNRFFHSSPNFCKKRTLFINPGLFISEGVCFYRNEICSRSGQIIAIHNEYLLIRAAKPYSATEGATIHRHYGDIIKEGDTLITLIYERLKSEDIIQGLPKVEQLLEARSIDSVSMRIEDIFEKWNKGMTRLIGNLWSHFLSVGTSMEHCQLVLVDQIRKVHRSQGVQISDKHVEIIVRQMTSKVITLEDGITNVSLPGELIESPRAQRMNRVLKESISYEPIVLGITRASLNTTSFLSEASFQETTRVLARAALRGRIDWLKGLKENVILGGIVPTGTGSQEVICQPNVEKQRDIGSTTNNSSILSQKIRNIFLYHSKVSGFHHRRIIHEKLKQPLSKIDID
uniref:DNA-directed RNA polymerase subunit beta'' n=1 Tax=Osmundastrum cinnamomeum TaxID=3284 RepID=A0A059SS27_OSMCI|nr:RNA polymerase beta' subunit [Osmundastrum cinnamomeum]AHA59547.1 RNA polymerase beta' subunit [Osmundastrum cinnamomeum]